MTAALHLSPLVAAGLVQGPIDVYESTITCKKKHKNRNSGHTNTTTTTNTTTNGNNHRGGRQYYPGSGALGRDIGVGIWSTAWWPFLSSLHQGLLSHEHEPSSNSCQSSSSSSVANSLEQQKNRQSYQTLLQDLEACGSYVKDVGYRTPNGSWLVKSELNASPFGIQDLLGYGKPGTFDTTNIENVDPALLFVREKDLLSCLRNAVKIERRLGTINYQSGVRVDGIENVHGDLGSLLLQTNDSEGNWTSSVSPQYNLIIAADGLYSPLRSRFAGHHSKHATNTGMEATPGGGRTNTASMKHTQEYQWEHTTGQREATQVEDREYMVFRGNAPKLESNDEDGSGSFQTWGEEFSMRFAAVPFYHETEDLDDDEDDTSNCSGHYSKSQSFISKKKDEEVWFATISDPVFIEQFKASDQQVAYTTNPVEQKQLLMKAFGSWHKPVQKLIETTPAEDIMYEMAIAHRHHAAPVFDVARIMEFEMWQENKKMVNGSSKESDGKIITGRGPMLCFIGDSFMTVDPVLAQGFTMAMESGASIVESIERSLVHQPGNHTTTSFDPKRLRDQLKKRHYQRERRLLQLLRSTELVQRLAQPHGFGAVFATWFIRPVVKLCPDVIKRKVFDYMMRYSLGLTGKKDAR